MNTEEQDESVKRRRMRASPSPAKHSEKEEKEINSPNYGHIDENGENDENDTCNEREDKISIEKFALEQSDGFWDLAMSLLSYVYLIIHSFIHS